MIKYNSWDFQNYVCNLIESDVEITVNDLIALADNLHQDVETAILDYCYDNDLNVDAYEPQY